MSAPSVLFLTHHPPFPTASGDAVRNWSLMRRLKERGWRVSLFTLSPDGWILPEARRTLEDVCDRVVTAPVRSSRLRRASRIVRSTLSRRPFQLDYFWDPKAGQLLEAELRDHDYDVLMVQLLYMYRYVPLDWRRRSVLDTHNAEYPRMVSMAQASGLSLRGLAARLEQGPSRRLEAEVAAQVARVLAVSEQEQRYFEVHAPGKVVLIPNGATVGGNEWRKPSGEAEVLFVGSLDYSANVKGAEFLIQDVLPRLKNRLARLTIVGRNPPDRLVSLARKASLPTEVTGFVDDLTPYYRRSRLMVAPIQFGGGTRLKILDAMSSGLPVVSTTIGCEGIGVRDGEQLVIADNAADMAASIDRLLMDDGLCERLSLAAFSFVKDRYDWRAIGAQLDRILTEISLAPAPSRQVA